MNEHEFGEFQVRGIVESDAWYFVGSSGNQTIRRGDVFRSAAHYHRDADHPVTRILDRCRPVEIRVEAIRIFGKQMDVLDPGVTATLMVTGNGIKDVSVGMVLLTESIETLQAKQDANAAIPA